MEKSKSKEKESEKTIKASNLGGIANVLLNNGNSAVVENSKTYEQLRKDYDNSPRSGGLYNKAKEFKQNNLDRNEKVDSINNFMEAAHIDNRVMKPKVTDIEPKDQFLQRKRASRNLRG